MPKMHLVKPDMRYDASIQAFRKEFLEAGDSMDGTAHLRHWDTTQAWLAKLDPLEVQYLFVREEDEKVCGMLQIRTHLNAYLERYAGHIGYCVAPSERRQGYAREMLRLSLEKCRKLGITDVLICCLRENEASRRTILACGGTYESRVREPESGEEIERYWVHLG